MVYDDVVPSNRNHRGQTGRELLQSFLSKCWKGQVSYK